MRRFRIEASPPTVAVLNAEGDFVAAWQSYEEGRTTWATESMCSDLNPMERRWTPKKYLPTQE